jgi:hypothetical protein
MRGNFPIAAATVFQRDIAIGFRDGSSGLPCIASRMRGAMPASTPAFGLDAGA